MLFFFNFFCCIFVPTKTIKTNKTMAKENVILESVVLYDDYNISEDDFREGYEEHCKINNITPKEETPYDFIYDSINMEWEDLLDNLKYSPYNKCECVVMGCLGLWFGNRDITPTRESNLIDAIKHCVGECDYAIIKMVNGHIEVKSMHHDGTNDFEIYCLNKLGENTMGADLTKECYHKLIRGYLF